MHSVLIVEDNSVDAVLLRRSLDEAFGATVRIRHCGTLGDAIAELQEDHRFHLVILDLGMPDGVGVNNIRRVRAADNKIPILVVSGWDQGFEHRLTAAGADAFLSKSALNSVSLRHAVESVVAASRSSTTPHQLAQELVELCELAADDQPSDQERAAFQLTIEVLQSGRPFVR